MSKIINLIWLIIAIILELLLGLIIFYSYPVISMLFFGEGAKSFMYSNFNGILWATSPILILLFNVYMIFNSKRLMKEKIINNYKIISVIYSISYGLFILYWFINKGFRI
jgi:hypothetical protein